MACKSFVDTFNGTYKNIFCFLCNTDTDMQHDTLYCVNIRQFGDSVASVNPPFLAMLDLDAVSRVLADSAIHCDIHTQFTDEKMVSWISFMKYYQ